MSPGIFPSFTILRSKGAKNIIILDIWNFYFYSDFDVFFPLGSSRWELSEVCQHIFSIFYHFRDKRGQRVQKCHFPWNVKFYFSSDFDGFFWGGPSWWVVSGMCQQIFSIFYRFRDKRGQMAKNVIFLDIWNFFYPILMGFFFGFLSTRAFSSVSTDFFCLLLFWDKRGQRGQKTSFSWI